jgi:LPPG:FO 2-phospho-L-lactate transferase
MRVAVLSGGVGGARFLRGVVDVVEPRDVTAIVNVGDDLEMLSLSVSPDLDSVVYALAGLADDARGWGRANETWHALDTVAALGGPSWFQLGDRDLGLHLVRTSWLRDGQALSLVTKRIAAALGIVASVVPATDDRVRTWIATPAGEFEFQEWFVARRHVDPVDAVRYEGAASARAAPGVLEALEAADAIAAEHGVAAVATFGHAGNGHPHQHYHARTAAELEVVERAVDATLRHVISVGGTVAAEHGIGKLKRRWLSLQLSPEQLGLMRAVKQELDPEGILAPGNVF